MSVGVVNKTTGERIPTAGTPLDKVGDLSLLHTTEKSNAVAAINEVVDEVATKVASAYHHAGTKTCVELVAGLLVAGNEGNVYNMTDSGTTTADFIEGAGQPIKAGDNVGIAKISDGVYKFDLLSGFVDTTNFVQKSQTAGLLKNDGTVNDEIEGDVATLKSGLTDLSEEVNGDATTYDFADVITIEDAIPSNLAGCTVKIEPVQSGSGDPSPTNVRPITGHTEVDVQRNGKNRFDYSACTNNAIDDQGYIFPNAIRLLSGLFSVEKNTNYVISFPSNIVFVGHVRYDENDNFVERVVIDSTTSPTVFQSTTGRIRLYFTKIPNTENISPSDVATVQLEKGSTATPFEPYADKTYTIALGSTIYGGTVDFNTGVMTVDRAVVDLGDLTWLYDGNIQAFWANDLSPVRKLLSTDALCSAYEVYKQEVDVIASAPVGKVSFQTNNNARVIIKDISYNDVSTFTTAVTGQKLCYELATPTTIQLTPQQIQLLKGTNTLTASTGQISVTVNGVSGAIGSVQEQVNATDAALADIAEKLPTAPTTDGAYVLTVTVADGTPTYSWESAT